MSVVIRVIYEGTTYDLDIQEDIPLRLDISAIENSEIGEFFGVGSQTFDLPGTKNNNRFFKHAYNIGGEDIPAFYNTIDGFIISKGETLLKGQFQLLETVKDEDGYVNYKCQITDETVQFKDNIQNKLIKNADWSEYEHTLNTGSIIDSWRGGLLGGKVYYPLADYGYNDPESQGNYPLFAFGEPDQFGNVVGNFFNNTATPIQPNQFLPAVRAKDTLEVICAQAGFSASGDFINSGYFSNLYLLPKAKEEIGIVISGSEQATGYAYNNYNQSISPNSTNVELAANQIAVDPLGKFFNSGSEGYVYYLADGNGQYEASAQIGFFNPVSFSTAVVEVEIRLVRGSFPFSAAVISSEKREFSSADGFNTFTLSTGGSFNSTTSEDLWVWVDYRTISGPTPPNLNLFGFSSQLRVDSAPEVFNNATVDMALQWPADLKSIDIVKGIIQQFNLVVYPHPTQSKTIVFAQFDDWIREGESKDWTEKWDTATRVSVKHTIDEEPQELILGNEDDADRFSVEAKESDPFYQYGTLRILADNNISQGSKSVKNKFAPTVLGGPFVSGSLTAEGNPTYNIDLGSSFAYPHLYKFENNQLKSYKFRTRIGFKSNNSFPSGSDKHRIVIGTGYGDVTIVTGSYGTLSNVNGLPAQPGAADLHFNNTYFKFAGPGLNLGNTTSNFDTYWKTYIDSLYWDENRKVTLDIQFNSDEYKNIKLNDIIFVKDQQYRINKISGFNVTQNDVATVELIRLYPQYYQNNPDCDFQVTVEPLNCDFTFQAVPESQPTATPTPTTSPTPTPTPTLLPPPITGSFIWSYDVASGSATGDILYDFSGNENTASISSMSVVTGPDGHDVLRFDNVANSFWENNSVEHLFADTNQLSWLVSWNASGYHRTTPNQNSVRLIDGTSDEIWIRTDSGSLFLQEAIEFGNEYIELTPSGSINTNCWNILQYSIYKTGSDFYSNWNLNDRYSGSIGPYDGNPSLAWNWRFGNLGGGDYASLQTGSLFDVAFASSASADNQQMSDNFAIYQSRYGYVCGYEPGATPTPTPSPTPTSTGPTPTPSPTPTSSPTPTPTPTPQVYSYYGLVDYGSYQNACSGSTYRTIYTSGPIGTGSIAYEDSGLTNVFDYYKFFVDDSTGIGYEFTDPNTTGQVIDILNDACNVEVFNLYIDFNEYDACTETVSNVVYAEPGSTLSNGTVLYEDINLQYSWYGQTGYDIKFIESGSSPKQIYYNTSTGVSQSGTDVCFTVGAFNGSDYTATTPPTPTCGTYEKTLYVEDTAQIGSNIYTDSALTDPIFTGNNWVYNDDTNELYRMSGSTGGDGSGWVIGEITSSVCTPPSPTPTPTPTVDLRTYSGDAAWGSFYDACNNPTSVTVYTDGPITTGSRVYEDSSLTNIFDFYQYLVITGSEADGKGFQFGDPNTTGVVSNVNNSPCEIGTFSLGIDFNEYEACTRCVTTTKYSNSSTFSVGIDLYTDTELEYDWTEGIGTQFTISGSNKIYEYDGAARFGGSGVVDTGQTCYTIYSFNASDSTSPTYNPPPTWFCGSSPEKTLYLKDDGTSLIGKYIYNDSCLTDTIFTGNNWVYNHDTDQLYQYAGAISAVTESYCPTPTPTPTQTPTPTPGPSPTPTPTPSERWIQIYTELCTQTSNSAIYNWYGDPNNFPSAIVYDQNSGWCMDVYYYGEGYNSNYDTIDCSSRFSYYDTCSDCIYNLNEVSCT
jgi:hypothetical protein